MEDIEDLHSPIFLDVELDLERDYFVPHLIFPEIKMKIISNIFNLISKNKKCIHFHILHM